MKVELNKKYKTRDGRDVVIYEIHLTELQEYSVHGAIFTGGSWSIRSWSDEGEWISGSENQYDLIEVKEKKMVPLSCTDELQTHRPFWMRKGSMMSAFVPGVWSDAIGGISLDTLFHEDWEYSEKFTGPWIKFSKEEDPSSDSKEEGGSDE